MAKKLFNGADPSIAYTVLDALETEIENDPWIRHGQLIRRARRRLRDENRKRYSSAWIGLAIQLLIELAPLIFKLAFGKRESGRYFKAAISITFQFLPTASDANECRDLCCNHVRQRISDSGDLERLIELLCELIPIIFKLFRK